MAQEVSAENTHKHLAVTPFIEEQGPIQAWCTSIRLFAEAATKAGKTLNRKSFVTADVQDQDIRGWLLQDLVVRKEQVYGPTQYQVVEIHNNVPPSATCKLKTTKQPREPAGSSSSPGRHCLQPERCSP